MYHGMIQVFGDGQDMVRHLATAYMARKLVSWNTMMSLFEVNKCSIQPWWPALHYLCSKGYK